MAAMSIREPRPRTRALIRAAVGIGILIAVFLQVGAGPFLRGLEAVSPATIAAAFALTAIATAAAAWRWTLIAKRLGVPIGPAVAVGAYYRSQFLNCVIPGGIVGDVHRAVDHGRSVGRVGQASRAVAAERIGGQAVQIVFAVAVLALIGVWVFAPLLGGLLGVLAVVAVVALVTAAVGPRARRAVRREIAVARIAFHGAGVQVVVAATSVIVVVCHAATFVVACLAVGVRATPPQLAAVALLTVLAGSIPLGIGGWGPREVVAAWAFTSVGLQAADGIAASTAFGVLATIALVPGAVVLAASVIRRPRRRDLPPAAPPLPARQESSA